MDRLEAYTGFLQVSLDEEAAAEAWAVERREAEAAARAAARRQQQQQQQQQATAASASGSGGVGAALAAGSPHAPARRLSTAFPDAAAPLRAAAAAGAPAEDAGVILGGGVAAKATTGAVLEIQPQRMCVQIRYCPSLPSIAPPIS